MTSPIDAHDQKYLDQKRRQRKGLDRTQLIGFQRINASRRELLLEQIFEKVLVNLEVRVVGPTSAGLERNLGTYSGKVKKMLRSTQLGRWLKSHRRWGLTLTEEGRRHALSLPTPRAILSWKDRDLENLLSSQGWLNAYNLTPDQLWEAIADYVQRRDGIRPRHSVQPERD